MKSKTQSPDKESVNDSLSADYLLEEYKMLRERFHSLRDEGIRRLNFHITFSSAVIGGILVLGNTLSPLGFRLILLAALIFLTSVGADVTQFMVTRDVVTDKVERMMSRIRHYFVERDPNIRNIVAFSYFDEPTSYVTKLKSEGVRRTAETFQSFTTGFTFGLVSDILNFPIELSVAIGVAVFIISLIILNFIAKKKLRKAFLKAEDEVQFPQNNVVGFNPKSKRVSKSA